MEHQIRKYHKEYTCIPQVVEKERKNTLKRYIIYKIFWVFYVLLLVSSILFLRLWMTAVFGLVGLCMLPALFCKKTLSKTPFLAIDNKYIQYIGNIISWNSLKHIIITYETNISKMIPFNYTVVFTSKSGKTMTVNTYYFEEQEGIIESIKLLADAKDIHVTSFNR